MSEPVVSQARSLGFTCELTVNGTWQILPFQPKENWLLSQLENRWLLSADNVAQMYLTSAEAIVFLKRRHQLLQHRSRGG
jgi:hypothetical protein